MDSAGNYWRAYVFIERVKSGHVAEKPEQAEQVGRAFGLFQKRLADLPTERIQETIPQFHNGVLRIDALEKAVREDKHNRVEATQPEIDFCRTNRGIVQIFADAQAKGELPQRITHNDTKIDNVLLDQETDEVMCIVDLDTVIRGSSITISATWCGR